jgi:ribonuclease HI
LAVTRRPAQERWLQRWHFMEAAGDRWWSFAGGVYLLRAIKRVHGMRLILPSWKQQRFAAQGLVRGQQEGSPNMSDEAVVTIYADGGCRGNPGPAAGASLLQAGEREKELWGGEGLTTNNRMELTAAIRALEALKRPATVHLHTDSQYVQKGISEWIHNWKRNGWRTADKKPVKNADLWQRLDELAGRTRSSGAGSKGMPGTAGNERADALANRAMDELRARPATR